MPIIVWFRRDLRLHDQAALAAACRDSEDGIIPVFVFDPAILRHADTGTPIVQFMLGCLTELRENLRAVGGDLVVLHGDPAEELAKLAERAKASALYFNRDYAPAAIARDARVTAALQAAGVKVESFKDQVIFEGEEVRSAASGRPYTVYSPYRAAWLKKVEEEGPKPLGKPKLRFSLAMGPSLRPSPGVPGEGERRALPSAQELGFDGKVDIEISVGESAARKMLKRFCAGPIGLYKDRRNLPAEEDGTSRLSPHLRHGTISVRQCWAAAMGAAKERPLKAGAEAWIGELIWREFFQQILYHFPRVAEGPFRQNRKIVWRKDEEGLAAWKAGRTGYPIVDAGVRQLAATGWMHNRVRMIAAMFLAKDLLIDYREGERWFMRNLIDGETAQNNGNWQWVASTGTDAQPYFRIFNPANQGRTYDPQGVYVRRWVPELAGVAEEFIHEPHLGEMRLDYPRPIVDHAEARVRALEAFRSS